MSESTTFGLSWPKDILEKVDIRRGDIPRSRYVLRLVEQSFALADAKVKKDGKK